MDRQRLATGEQLGSPTARGISLDVNPVRPVLLPIIHDEDHRIGLGEPEFQVAATDEPGDGPSVGEPWQPIGRLHLDEDEAGLEFAGGLAISGHGQIVSIVVLDAVHRESAEQDLALDMVDAEVEDRLVHGGPSRAIATIGMG
jgi:hypothetical protein